MRRRVMFTVLAFLAPAAAALAGDRELVRALDGGVAGVRAASAAAAGGAPGRVQVHYDLARDLQERVRAAAPYSRSCHALGGWAARFLAAEVAAAEAHDRLQPVRAGILRRTAARARDRLAAARRACRPSIARGGGIATLLEPRPTAASFGVVVARAPAGADGAALRANGVSAGRLAISGGVARGRLVAPPGRYDLEVVFDAGGARIGRARSPDVWLLSPPPQTRPATLDPGWQARVRAAAAAFPGTSAAWIHDLATGRAASWNAGALFPAASLVKLGVLIEAVRRMGPQPERSAMFHDARAIGGWSSNLAANRLVRRVGGRAVIQAALARAGAATSTYPGPYLVATQRPPVDAPAPPPRVSRRLTTADDLGRVMVAIHDAARGDAIARRRTRLSRAQARLVLGFLLATEQVGDNRGLLRDALGPATPAAQKQGWISSARHTAAVVYTGRGPVVIVALTSRRGISRAAAAVFGGALVRITSTSPP